MTFMRFREIWQPSWIDANYTCLLTSDLLGLLVC